MNRSLYRRPLRIEPLEDRRLLALVTVTTALDTVNFNDGVTSLREAIFATNIVPGADSINFDFGHDGPATILLTQGELKITDSLTINGPGTSLLMIDATGSDPTPELDNSDGSRLFSIGDEDEDPSTLIDVSISGLSLTGGDAKIAQQFGSLLKGHGGAINFSARLTLTNTNIFENHADRGGGVGGNGTLTVINTMISDNSADTSGGGIATAQANVFIDQTTIANNRVTRPSGGNFTGGGGILTLSGNLTVDESIVSGNQVEGSSHGGGIHFNPAYASDLSLEVRQSTISGNRVDTGGGGGISAHVRNSHILLEDNTIEANTLSNGIKGGAGVHFDLRDATVAIRHNVVRHNSGGMGSGVYLNATNSTAVIESSTVSENSSTGGALGGGPGGAIFWRNQTDAGSLTITGTTIHANTSTGTSGGIHASSFVELIDCNVSENVTYSRGSAIVSFGGIALRDTIVSGNTSLLTLREGASTIYASGDVMLENSTVRDNVGHGVVGRNVTLSDSTITGNSGAGISARYAVSIDHSDILNNDATGVSTRDGNVTIHDSTIAGNGSAGISAGLFASPSVTLTATAVSNNAAGIIATGDVSLVRSSVTGNVNNLLFSAGIFARGNVILNDSTVSGNAALGIYTRGAGVYGGRSVTLNQSTVSGNTSSERGGGIASYGNIAIRYSTVANNTAGLTGGGIHSGNPQYHDLRIEIVGSIVAGNTAVGGKPDIEPGASTLDVQYSLIGDQDGTTLVEAPVGAPDANGNLIGGLIHGDIDPLLGPLADNGGPTQTHAFLSGSPAINRGDLNAVAGENGVPEFDQRGESFGRVFGGRIDIGAFEYQESSDLNLLVDTLADESDGDYSRGDLSLREAVALANQWAGHDTIHFDLDTMTAGLPLNGLAPVPTISLTMGELSISDDLSIAGPAINLLAIDASASDPTPDQNNGDGSRVFRVQDGDAHSFFDVQMSGLTLTGGDAATQGGAIWNSEQLTITETLITANAAQDFGGGVYSTLGTLYVENTDVFRNESRWTSGGGLAVEAGELNFVASSLGDNRANLDGGGLYMLGGTLNMVNAAVAGNTAFFRRGGGLALYGTEAALIDVEIVGNSSVWSGGGIFVTDGSLTVSESQINGNRGDDGGGIAADSSMVAVFQTTIDNNRANSGGGLSIFQGTMIVRHSSITGNRWGGIGSRSSRLELDACTISGNQGGVRVQYSTCAITNTTLSGNTLFGAVVSWDSTLHIAHSTITENSGTNAGGIWLFGGGTNLTLDHTIVAGNQHQAGEAPDILRTSSNSTISSRFSIIGDATGSDLAETFSGVPDADGNLIGGPMHGIIDPQLGPLADNGGFTLPDGNHILTHALLAGSPAINRGDLNAVPGENGVPLYDQRGEPFARVFGGRIDVGAFEYQMPSDLNLLVDTLVDESDGDYSRYDLSLREAIELANMFDGHDTIRFDPILTASGPATIQLAHGQLIIRDTASIDGPGANLLTIDASIEPPTSGEGPVGSRIFFISDGNVSNLLDVAISSLALTGGEVAGTQYGGGAILSRENLTITASAIRDNSARFGGAVDHYLGSLTVADSSITHNTAQLHGGGISSFQPLPSSSLTVIRSTISGNTAGQIGGGIDALWQTVTVADSTISNNVAGSYGGGISIRNSSSYASLTVTGSSISGNTADWGGGIRMDRGNLSVTDTTISGNTAVGGGFHPNSGSGGGIFSQARRNFVTNTVISGNSATINGGGMFSSSTNRGTALQIDASTFEENHADQDGGGLFIDGFPNTIAGSTFAANSAGRNGGGVAVQNGGTTLTNSTLSDNFANSFGGAVWANRGVSIVHSTVFANRAASAGGGVFVTQGITLSHSIIAGNLAPIGSDLTGFLGATITPRYSLIGSNANTGLTSAPVGSPDANGNLIGGPTSSSRIDPRLGALTDNGGPTRTHALLPGSPALNAGDPAAVPGVDNVPVHDQRGAPFTRVFGGRIDVGAFESLPAGFLPGDYNRDGIVHPADETLWRDALGTAVPPGTSADGNGDGVVNDLDHEVWKNNFGATIDDLPLGAAIQAAKQSPQSKRDPNVELQSFALAQRSVVARRQVFSSLAQPMRTAGYATNNDGLVAWMTAQPSARRRVAESIGDELCAAPAEKATASRAWDAVFDELGGVL